MMKRHDDPFFEMFREGLQGYEATPPAGAQAAIKQRLAKGNFFHFAWNRLNIYYAALLIGAGVAGAFLINQDGRAVNSQSALIPHVDSELVLSAVQNRLANANVEVENDESELFASATQYASTAQTTTSSSKTKRNLEILSGIVSTINSEIDLEIRGSVADHRSPCVSNEMEIEPISAIEQTQLPIDWMNHLKTPNLSSLISQLDSEQETIHLKLPVTVTVEK